MKLLILGSEGFIGSHCVEYFTKRNHAILGVDLYEQPAYKYDYQKISRLSPEFDELFLDGKFDAVINAGGSGNVPYSMAHPLLDFESNCLDTIRLLDCIRKHKADCKYIHLSSAAVYGNPERMPVSESDSLKPLSPYGWHKLISENLCNEYAVLFKVSLAILRPFSVYGPRLRKQFFWDLFQKMNDSEVRVELLGTGDESRDYIHVRDVVHAMDLVLEKGPMKGEVYNVASGSETSIREAAMAFGHAINYKGRINFSGSVRAGDPLNWKADISRLKSIGFAPEFELDAGLKSTVAWLANTEIK